MFNYTVNQLNSPFDDAAFFVRNLFKKKPWLFDCGRLGGLEHSEILSLGDIYVSHTHMDHFVGFDRIIRGSLMSDNCLRFFGPPGFIDNVDGKFRSYTWNLVDDYTFSVEAVELHPSGNSKRALFAAGKRFIPEITDISTAGNQFDLGEGFTLLFDFFDHRTLSIGYKITEPERLSVNKDLLLQKGYLPGPWIKLLKEKLESDELNAVITAETINGAIEKTVKELENELITRQIPQSVTYITDIAPSDKNIEKAVNLAKNSTLLIIEAVFTEEDIEHAVLKNHLTMNISKEIFNCSGAEYVRFTHFAARYEQDKGSFLSQLYKGVEGKVYKINPR